MKPQIQPLSRQSLVVPERSTALTVNPPAEMATVPMAVETPRTRWGLRRQARYYKGLTEMTNARTGYFLARAENAKAFVAAARAAHEVAELPEICENDTDVRRLKRQRDLLDARREVAEAEYGLLATMGEVDKLRRPLRQKASKSTAAAVDALMRAKIDQEALGEDTSGLDAVLATLQRS